MGLTPSGWDISGVVDTNENVEVIDFQQDWEILGVGNFFPEMIWKEELSRRFQPHQVF